MKCFLLPKFLRSTRRFLFVNIKELKPDSIDWEVGKSITFPVSFWKNEANQRSFFDFIAKKFNIKSFEDWYTISSSNLLETAPAVGELLTIYGYSLGKTLIAVYPEYVWDRSKFTNEVKAHKEFFDQLAKKIGIKNLNDWNKVSVHDIVKQGGINVLKYYDMSLTSALAALYPKHNWESQNIKYPLEYWKQESNQRKFLESIKEKLNIKIMDDWHRVTIKEVADLGGSGLLRLYGGSLRRALQVLYPEYDWSSSADPSTVHLLDKLPQSRPQVYIFEMLSQLFPNVDIYVDYTDPKLLFETSKTKIEFDIAIPSLSLVFEYQGEQHFFFSQVFGSAVSQQRRDSERRQACKKAKLTLIEIPFWWDGKQDTLIATIRKERPDLLKDSDVETLLAIPKDPPQHVLEKIKKKENKRLQDIPFPPVKTWDSKWDPANWWISEKLDGIRAYWDGKQMYLQRNFKSITLSEKITRGLPRHPLDGELWIGRGKFNELSDIITLPYDQVTRDQWNELTFQIFDTPHYHESPFEERQKRLESIKNYLPCFYAFLIVLKINEQLEQTKSSIIEQGGEGIILRRRLSKYFDRDSFFKWKHYFEEKALVVGKTSSAIICELPNGISVTVPTTFPLSFFYENKTVVGLKSKTNFLESKEMPSDITIDKIRFEAEWKNVMSEYSKRKVENSGIAYWVSLGSNRCTCAGCKRVIYNKEEPRLRTNLSNWLPPSQGDEEVLPRSIDINICLNVSCVQRAIEKYRKMGISIANFDGKAVAKEDKKLSVVEGIQFIHI